MENLYEAWFWTKLEDGKIECQLCPHHCKLQEGQNGICQVRGVRNSKLYSLYYEMVATGGQVDPIEKKPLYHFYPGTQVLSFGGLSCNLHCDHCQNYTLSQEYEIREMSKLDVQQILKAAQKTKCRGVAWTYNEPTIYFETYYNWSVVLKKAGLYVVWVSNAYISPEPLKKLAEVVDAVNFDVKAFREEFFVKYTRSKFQPVLDACIQARKCNMHLELTYLIIPTLNDSSEEIQQYVQWVKDHLGTETPLHFSRFYPHHRMSHLPPTPVETVFQAVKCAQNLGFPYVYAGNIYPNPYNNTLCPKCSKVLVNREGYSVKSLMSTAGVCPFCKAQVPFIF